MLSTRGAKIQPAILAKLGVKPLTGGKPDYWLLALVALLLILGTVMIYSASFVTAIAGPDHNGASILFRHLMWVAVGMVALFGAALVDYHRWRQISIPAMLIVLGLLGVILFLPEQLAPIRYGAKRWIALGEESNWQFQPSEVAKLVLIVYAAHWLSSKGERVKNFTLGLLPFAITVGAIIALVIVEPDMGTSLVIGAIGLGMFFVAGANLLHLVIALGSAGGVFYVVTTLTPYRLDRLKAYTDPLATCAENSYHTCQALLGLGSGGLFGVGLGASRSKFFWLPTVYTDSIFAVVGEELGWFGTCLLVFLFLALAWRGFSIARHAPDGYGRLVATGVTVYIVFQAFLNMAVVSNLVPFTGIPLPFISYGGSSLAVTMAAIGLLLNVSRQQVDNPRILELEVQREAERRRRDLLREQREAERERREAQRRLQEKQRADQEARELEMAQKAWEQRSAQERAELAWREQVERELKRQKAEEAARKAQEQAMAEARELEMAQQAQQQEENLPAPASHSFLEFGRTRDKSEPDGKIKLRKPRRDWAKVYSNLAGRNHRDD